MLSKDLQIYFFTGKKNEKLFLKKKKKERQTLLAFEEKFLHDYNIILGICKKKRKETYGFALEKTNITEICLEINAFYTKA